MFSRRHIRVEFNRAKTELLIGTVVRNSNKFEKGAPVYSAPRDRVQSSKDLAVAVDYYAKVQRVSNDATFDAVVMRAYNLRHGTTIDGNI